MILDHSMTIKSLLEGVEYRVARSRQELEKAFHLVYQEYLKQGYVDEDPSQMRFLLHNALPETTTFVALIDGVVTATATVIADSPLGLPMDELYHQELEELRRGGKHLCEVSMLANSSELFSEQVPMMLNAKKMFLIFFLFKHIFDYVRLQVSCDYICVMVNPKHANAYDSLMFQDIGGMKRYDKVNGAPAVAKYLRVHDVDPQVLSVKRQSLYKMFLSSDTNPEKFSGKFQWGPYDLKHFFVDLKSLIQNAPQEYIEYIKKCYPGYNFFEIFPHCV